MPRQGHNRSRRRNRDTAIRATQKLAARRRRASGELYVAQTADLVAAGEILADVGEAAGIITGGLDPPGPCWIAASIGGAISGVVGAETKVDAAASRLLDC